MTTKENPAPRANARSRANSKVEQLQIIASPVDWKADAGGRLACKAPCGAGGAGARPGRAGEPWEGLSMNGPIDFAAINRAALEAFPACLRASCREANASAPRLSRSIRAAPIATSVHSRLPALHGELDEAAP